MDDATMMVLFIAFLTIAITLMAIYTSFGPGSQELEDPMTNDHIHGPGGHSHGHDSRHSHDHGHIHSHGHRHSHAYNRAHSHGYEENRARSQVYAYDRGSSEQQ